MEKIIEILKKSCDAYYNSDTYYEMNDVEMEMVRTVLEIPCQSLMSDPMYDTIYRVAKSICPSNPFFLSVGSDVRGGKVQLPEPMGSMTECKEGDMERWIIPNCDYVISSKLDGCSCMLVYENGNLKIAYSRGNGIEGADITRHIRRFKSSIPSNICMNGVPFSGLLRGEIIVAKSDIVQMLNELLIETKRGYKNGRNTVAGQLNAETCAETFTKYAKFVSYYIKDFNGSEYEMFETLKLMGFETPNYMLINGKEINDDYLMSKVKETKETDRFECDGIIVTQNVVQSGFDGYDTSSLNPKKSRKFKIGAGDNTAITTVKGIEWNISKDGVFVPRVSINPIDILGVTISWVSGHNYKNIIDNKISIGSKVLISRRGDVIPHIEQVVESSDNNDYNLPDFLLIEKDGVDITLTSDVKFPPNTDIHDEYDSYINQMNLFKTLYFCTKLGVDFAGIGNLMKLGYSGKSIQALLLSKKQMFEELIGVNGAKLYDSLYEKLNNATVCQFMDAVGAFGRGIGELKLQKIFDKYGDLINDKNKILDVEGWSDKTTNQYLSNYSNYVNWLIWLKDVKSFEFKKPTISNSTQFNGVQVVFTGVRDKGLQDYITLNGGKVLSSFTKGCNLVVAKDPMGSSSKLQKARELGVEIISLEEARARFGCIVTEKRKSLTAKQWAEKLDMTSEHWMNKSNELYKQLKEDGIIIVFADDEEVHICDFKNDDLSIEDEFYIGDDYYVECGNGYEINVDGYTDVEYEANTNIDAPTFRYSTRFMKEEFDTDMEMVYNAIVLDKKIIKQLEED